MFPFTLKRALIGALMCGLPGMAAAQDAPAGPEDTTGASAHSNDAAGLQAEVGAWLAEMQDVHQQLEGLQQQALSDPAILAEQEAIGEEIRVAMAAADPMLDQQLARIGEIETEAMAAQQAGNAEALQLLMTEAQQIQERFMTVQQEVLGQSQIATRVSNFQVRLESKMVELDPSAQSLIVRFRELETLLNEAIGA